MAGAAPDQREDAGMTDNLGCICLDCNHRLEQLKPCTNCGSHRVDMWSPGWDGMPDWTRISYHDRQGNPLTLLEYAEKFATFEERKEYKQVAYTEVGGMAFVSTVWLGVNHRMGPGPPLIFETMAFVIPRDDDPPGLFGHPNLASLDEFIASRRYSTEEQALAGHAEVVAEVEAWLAEQRAWIEVAVADIEGEQD